MRRYWRSQAMNNVTTVPFPHPASGRPRMYLLSPNQNDPTICVRSPHPLVRTPPADNAAWPRVQRWRLSQASKSPIHHDQAPVSARPVQSCGLVSQFSSCPPIAVAATAPSRRLNCQPTRDTALALLIPRSDETVHSAPGRVITSSAPRRGHREAGRHV